MKKHHLVLLALLPIVAAADMVINAAQAINRIYAKRRSSDTWLCFVDRALVDRDRGIDGGGPVAR
jgi:hypothetical protein